MNRKLIFIIVLAVVLVILGGNIAGVYMDYLWFMSNGGEHQFWVLFMTRFNVHIIFTVLFILLFALNFLLIRLMGGKGRFFAPGILDRIHLPVLGTPKRAILLLLALLVVATGIIMGGYASAYWKEYLLFSNALPFTGHATDPVFHRDIGFYVFSLPFYRFLYGWVLASLVIITVFSVLFHYINRGIFVEGGIEFSLFARAHLSTLLALIVLLIGTGYRLSAYDLLFSPGGRFFGAGYTAVHARLLAYNVAMVLSFIASALLLFNVVRRSFVLPMVVLAALIPSYFILGTVYPAIQQRFVVEPNELEKETPFILNNITATRMAYGIDRVNEIPFANSRTITMADIKKNRDTLDNVRLWDWRPLKQTYKQLQELKPYYFFNDIDVDRYVIKGRSAAVNISAREFSMDGLGRQGSTWQNRHLIYTHGYGVVMSRVDRVSEDGQPEFLIHDIPPRSVTDIKEFNPRIYYGENRGEYCITGTTIQPGEFDHPTGNDNSFTTYDGSGGVPVGGILRRLLLALGTGDINILISGNINSGSRILYRRNIVEMARSFTPFLEIDDDPYVVISGGRLYWILDAYTVSDRYPYSSPVDMGERTINYIRNSVKITIDAYSGEMRYYLADGNDPVALVYGRIFPGLFKPMDTMPADLRSHVRYPGTLFDIQAAVLSRYHVTEPNVFYNNEDAWDIARQVYEDNETEMSSYYLITTLPGESRSGFSLILPFTPRKKNNMIAFLAAGCDDDRYGKLTLYVLPKEKLNYGPLMIQARINQDPEISKLLTLWGQRGSRVIRGNMMAIPVNDSLLFIEPLYLKAEASEMPELKLVVAATGDRLAGENSLDTTLEKLFDSMPFSPADTDISAGLRELSEKAYRHYMNAETHMKNGNWAAYGDELRRLKETLIQMKGARE